MNKETSDQTIERLNRAISNYHAELTVLLTAIRHLCTPIAGKPYELIVGDIIVGIQKHNSDVLRKIVGVRKTGYDWHYLFDEKEIFVSENSSDPHFFHGWVRLPTK